MQKTHLRGIMILLLGLSLGTVATTIGLLYASPQRIAEPVRPLLMFRGRTLDLPPKWYVSLDDGQEVKLNYLENETPTDDLVREREISDQPGNYIAAKIISPGDCSPETLQKKFLATPSTVSDEDMRLKVLLLKDRVAYRWGQDGIGLGDWGWCTVLPDKAWAIEFYAAIGNDLSRHVVEDVLLPRTANLREVVSQ